MNLPVKVIESLVVAKFLNFRDKLVRCQLQHLQTHLVIALANFQLNPLKNLEFPLDSDLDAHVIVVLAIANKETPLRASVLIALTAFFVSDLGLLVRNADILDVEFDIILPRLSFAQLPHNLTRG